MKKIQILNPQYWVSASTIEICLLLVSRSGYAQLKHAYFSIQTVAYSWMGIHVHNYYMPARYDQGILSISCYICTWKLSKPGCYQMWKITPCLPQKNNNITTPLVITIRMYHQESQINASDRNYWDFKRDILRLQLTNIEYAYCTLYIIQETMTHPFWPTCIMCMCAHILDNCQWCYCFAPNPLSLTLNI